MKISPQGGYLLWLVAGAGGSWAGNDSHQLVLWNLWLRVDGNLSFSYIPVSRYRRIVSFLFLFPYFLWVTLFLCLALSFSLQDVRAVSLQSCQKAAGNLQAFLPLYAESTSQWGSPPCEESGACLWRLDSSCWYLGMLDLRRQHYIWVHVSPGMPEMECLLQRKREASLAHQSDVIPIINTQSSISRNNTLLQQNSRTDLPPAGDWICSMS